MLLASSAVLFSNTFILKKKIHFCYDHLLYGPPKSAVNSRYLTLPKLIASLDNKNRTLHELIILFSHHGLLIDPSWPKKNYIYIFFLTLGHLIFQETIERKSRRDMFSPLNWKISYGYVTISILHHFEYMPNTLAHSKSHAKILEGTKSIVHDWLTSKVVLPHPITSLSLQVSIIYFVTY